MCIGRAADNSLSQDKFPTKLPPVLSTMSFVRPKINSEPWVKNCISQNVRSILNPISSSCATRSLSPLSPCRNIPYVGPYIQSPFSEYLDKQKKKLHIKPGTRTHVSMRTLAQSKTMQHHHDFCSLGIKPAAATLWLPPRLHDSLLRSLHCQLHGTELRQEVGRRDTQVQTAPL